MVIAAVVVFRGRRPSKLGAPKDKRVIKQAASSKIGEQTGYGAINLRRLGYAPGLYFLMVVPRVVCRDLNISHAAFRELAGQQALPSKVVCRIRSKHRIAPASPEFRLGS